MSTTYLIMCSWSTLCFTKYFQYHHLINNYSHKKSIHLVLIKVLQDWHYLFSFYWRGNKGREKLWDQSTGTWYQSCENQEASSYSYKTNAFPNATPMLSPTSLFNFSMYFCLLFANEFRDQGRFTCTLYNTQNMARHTEGANIPDSIYLSYLLWEKSWKAAKKSMKDMKSGDKN